MLAMLGAGFGTVGAAATIADPLAAQAPHFPAKAKRIIYLFLNGGPSQVDTFDPKPMLDKYQGKPLPAGNLRTERKTGNLLKSPFKFERYGQSGIEVNAPALLFWVFPIALFASPRQAALSAASHCLSKSSTGAAITE